jgi:hypothetical protein
MAAASNFQLRAYFGNDDNTQFDEFSTVIPANGQLIKSQITC